MILADANILIYATDPRWERHEQAQSWLDGQLSGDTRVGLPWASFLAHMRIVTNPRVFERPRSVTIAGRHVVSGLTANASERLHQAPVIDQFSRGYFAIWAADPS